MKISPFFFIFTLICCSCVQIKNFSYSGEIMDPELYKVVSIKEYKSLYIIYIQRNDSSFKIISEKVKTNNPNCKMIKKGGYYYFNLNVIFPTDTLMGLSVVPNLGIKALKYKESTVYLEDKSHNKLYKANNMEGLCLFENTKNK